MQEPAPLADRAHARTGAEAPAGPGSEGPAGRDGPSRLLAPGPLLLAAALVGLAIGLDRLLPAGPGEPLPLRFARSLSEAWPTGLLGFYLTFISMTSRPNWASDAPERASTHKTSTKNAHGGHLHP